MANSKESYDIDTSNMIVEEGINVYEGRKEIIIDATLDDFRADPIKIINDNLGTIQSEHNTNVSQMKYLRRFEKGVQDILKKARANGDMTINNKHITNYAWQFTNFKKGYYVGKPIKYVDLNTNDTEDMKYFNMYLRSEKKASKDLIKYENMLLTGIAYTMTIPKRVKCDNTKESPFEYHILNNEDWCVVRSNDTFKTKLFSMCFSEVKRETIKYKVYTVYYDDICLILELGSDNGLRLVEQRIQPIPNCITEYQLNEQRMGVFEPILNSLNTLNKTRSNQLDQLEEFVNNYLTFKNIDATAILEQIDNFRKKRILAVQTNNPELPADIGSIAMDNDTTSVNSFYNNMEQRNYDIIGVPMATSSTGQGVSGEAQVYGGGWENAQTFASVDTLYIMQFEMEDLEKFIEISQNSTNTKTPNLIPANMEIKYTINKSNNMLVKAQSSKYFVDMGCTYEQAFSFSEITDDPQTEGKIAELNKKQQEQNSMELELQKTERTNAITQNSNNNDNSNNKQNINE